MVEGETVLSLGKQIRRMTAGQAYKIPPTGITAHSNLNLGDEPVEMIFMGPAGGGGGGRGGPGGPAAQASRSQGGPAAQGRDFARLDNGAYNRATEQDIDMFMGDWRNAFPRIMHGNFYFRDMLTALQGTDELRPARRGAVLTNAEAVSYVQLEPGATAHRVEGELKNIQQTFVVNSGTGVITSGSTKVELVKGMAFIITPGLDFRLTATGDQYMTFYVVSEKLPGRICPANDSRGRRQPQPRTGHQRVGEPGTSIDFEIRRSQPIWRGHAGDDEVDDDVEAIQQRSRCRRNLDRHRRRRRIAARQGIEKASCGHGVPRPINRHYRARKHQCVRPGGSVPLPGEVDSSRRSIR